ncbi:hypothetical protein QL285_096731 [Trifolium repens]|nr:hypothetical protein QL285_096731 [Trifolium repens]
MTNHIRPRQAASAPGSRLCSLLAYQNWSKTTLELINGRYKCNIDASFSPHHNRIGIVMCIRDDEGRFILAKTMWNSHVITHDYYL